MTQRHEVKQRSPAVWARVKAAYLAGETAASVARRFDVGYGNLRFRANAEGWTRKAAMAAAEAEEAVEQVRLNGQADGKGETLWEAPDIPADVDPQQTMAQAVRRAADMIGRGRGAEAMLLLKAAEALGRASESVMDLSPADPDTPTPEGQAVSAEQVATLMAQVEAEIEARANRLALELLTDRGPSRAAHGAFAFRWRAWVLGPEVALADFRAGVDGGWADRHWDAEGRLIPQLECPRKPDMLMIRQHLRHCQGADWGQEDVSGWTWPPRDWWGAEEMEDEAAVETSKAETGPKVWRL